MTSTLLTATHEALTEIETMLDALHLALATPEQLDSLETDVNQLLALVDTAEVVAGLIGSQVERAYQEYCCYGTPLEDWLLDELAKGWRLSKRGKPLTGAALTARRRKVTERLVAKWMQVTRKPVTTL